MFKIILIINFSYYIFTQKKSDFCVKLNDQLHYYTKNKQNIIYIVIQFNQLIILSYLQRKKSTNTTIINNIKSFKEFQIVVF